MELCVYQLEDESALLEGPCHVHSSLWRALLTLTSILRALLTLTRAPHSYARSSLLCALLTLTHARLNPDEDRQDHKVRTYKEYHSVRPSSELGLSQPLSRQRVFPSPQKQGGGGTLACGWGVGGESQFRRGAYTVVLFLCTYFLDRTNMVGSGWAMNTLTVLLITTKVILMEGRKTN
jgi:hypothetical protein